MLSTFVSSISYAEDVDNEETTITTTTTSHTSPQTKPPPDTDPIINDETTEPIDEEETTEPGGTGESPGPTGGGDVYVEITHNHYYYLDVGLQFKPRVGVITSINNSADLLDMGSNRDSYKVDQAFDYPSTVWTPSLSELPDITGMIGSEYSYGVLYNGYWDTPLIGEKKSMHIINPTTPSDVDSTTQSIERSWDNRDPGQVITDDVGEGNEGAAGEKEGFEEFYTDYEREVYNPVTEEPDWDNPDNWDTYRSYEHSGEQSAIKVGDDDCIVTPYTQTVWYRETDTTKPTQDADAGNHYALPQVLPPYFEMSDEFRRALNVLGWDILLRDEWVGSTVVGQDANEKGGYYAYLYSNTNVLDYRLQQTEFGGHSLLTQDYVIQSIYRALGVNCLTSQIYFYADKDLSVNFTPLAEKITVAMDKINEVQNRVDVFVTRAGLENYWNKAVEDGVVSNYGVTVLNDIDGAYKPFAKRVEATTYTDGTYYADPGYKNDKGEQVETGLKYADGVWVEKDARIDYNRTKTITLAEFCVYVKRLMDIYGEEVLTDKEMDMLLVYHGTKLPYGLDNDEQFEAIKYLMAKGIVNDMMYWNGDLRLEDMLIILSRVKDEGSRLTYKELELTYDEALLDQGYYPANISIVEEPTVNVVATTHSSSYSYKNAEWFDYFIHIPAKVQVTQDGDLINEYVNPLFLTVENGYEKYTEDIFLVKANPEDKGFDGTGADIRQYDGFEIVGKENLADGYQYLHIRVSTSLLFKDGAPNPDFVRYVEGVPRHIVINTSNTADAPQRWYIDYRGGIFRNPVVKKTAQHHSNGNPVLDENGNQVYKNNAYWESSGYYSGNSRTVSSTMKSLDTGVAFPNDIQSLREQGTAKSLIISLHPDGSVKDCRTYNYGTDKNGKDILDPKVESTKYLTFDNAGWGLTYCDYERYTTGWSISLTENPLLTDVTSALGEMIPQYDLWFYILCDTENSKKLSSDVYWGSSDNKSLLISRNDPKNVYDVEGTDISFVSYSEGKYYYVAHGQNTEASLSMNIHVDSDQLNASYTTGYIRNNDTILVPAKSLISMVETIDDKNYYLRNGAVTKLSEDLISITFDVGGTVFGDSAIHTIYLYEPLKLLIVNNTVYKIPVDEVLFIDNTEKSSNGDLLVNYRAVLGWASGYRLKPGVGCDGDVEVSLGMYTNDDVSRFVSASTLGLYNAYTFEETGVTLAKRNDMYSIPSTTSFNWSNWLIYVSETEGTWMFVFKNNDYNCSDSVIKSLINTDPDKLTRVYGNASWLDATLGISSSVNSSHTGDMLLATYNLTSPTCTVVCEEDDVVSSNKDCYGKMYYDTNLHCWCYVPMYYTGVEYSCDPGTPIDLEDILTAGEYFGEETNEYKRWSKYWELADDIHSKYYSGDLPLPFYGIYGQTFLLTGATNTVDGLPYGSVPGWAYSFDSSVLSSNRQNEWDINFMYYHGLEWINLALFTEVNVRPMVYCPMSTIVGIPTIELSNDNFKYLRVRWGNYPLAFNGETLEITTDYYAKHNKYGASTIHPLNASDIRVNLIASSMTDQLAYYDALTFSYTPNRDILIDKTTQASLQDLDQIPGVDWGQYTFDRLIHDVDNGLSIVLIIVLNFIPRAGIFIFVILIGLATVANAKPMKQFCHSVFDPFKLVSFGHLTVDTVDTRMLLISSMIGLAVFALFMDGTILNVLTWLVQFVSSFITR